MSANVNGWLAGLGTAVSNWSGPANDGDTAPKDSNPANTTAPAADAKAKTSFDALVELVGNKAKEIEGQSGLWRKTKALAVAGQALVELERIDVLKDTRLEEILNLAPRAEGQSEEAFRQNVEEITKKIISQLLLNPSFKNLSLKAQKDLLDLYANVGGKPSVSYRIVLIDELIRQRADQTELVVPSPEASAEAERTRDNVVAPNKALIDAETNPKADLKHEKIALKDGLITVAKLDPTDVDAHVELTRIYFREGDIENAKRHIGLYVRYEKDLAQLERSVDGFKNMNSGAKDSIFGGNDDGSIVMFVADELLKSGREDLARRALESNAIVDAEKAKLAGDEESKNPEARAEHYAKALRYYEDAIAFHPKEAKNYFSIMSIYFKLGNLAQAHRYAELYVRHQTDVSALLEFSNTVDQPGFPQKREFLGKVDTGLELVIEVLNRVGRIDDAQAFLSRAAEAGNPLAQEKLRAIALMREAYSNPAAAGILGLDATGSPTGDGPILLGIDVLPDPSDFSAVLRAGGHSPEALLAFGDYHKMHLDYEKASVAYGLALEKLSSHPGSESFERALDHQVEALTQLSMALPSEAVTEELGALLIIQKATKAASEESELIHAIEQLSKIKDPVELKLAIQEMAERVRAYTLFSDALAPYFNTEAGARWKNQEKWVVEKLNGIAKGGYQRMGELVLELSKKAMLSLSKEEAEELAVLSSLYNGYFYALSKQQEKAEASLRDLRFFNDEAKGAYQKVAREVANNRALEAIAFSYNEARAIHVDWAESPLGSIFASASEADFGTARAEFFSQNVSRALVALEAKHQNPSIKDALEYLCENGNDYEKGMATYFLSPRDQLESKEDETAHDLINFNHALSFEGGDPKSEEAGLLKYREYDLDIQAGVAYALARPGSSESAETGETSDTGSLTGPNPEQGGDDGGDYVPSQSGPVSLPSRIVGNTMDNYDVSSRVALSALLYGYVADHTPVESRDHQNAVRYLKSVQGESDWGVSFERFVKGLSAVDLALSVSTITAAERTSLWLVNRFVFRRFAERALFEANSRAAARLLGVFGWRGTTSQFVERGGGYFLQYLGAATITTGLQAGGGRLMHANYTLEHAANTWAANLVAFGYFKTVPAIAGAAGQRAGASIGGNLGQRFYGETGKAVGERIGAAAGRGVAHYAGGLGAAGLAGVTNHALGLSEDLPYGWRQSVLSEVGHFHVFMVAQSAAHGGAARLIPGWKNLPEEVKQNNLKIMERKAEEVKVIVAQQAPSAAPEAPPEHVAHELARLLPKSEELERVLHGDSLKPTSDGELGQVSGEVHRGVIRLATKLTKERGDASEGIRLIDLVIAYWKNDSQENLDALETSLNSHGYRLEGETNSKGVFVPTAIVELSPATATPTDSLTPPVKIGELSNRLRDKGISSSTRLYIAAMRVAGSLFQTSPNEALKMINALVTAFQNPTKDNIEPIENILAALGLKLQYASNAQGRIILEDIVPVASQGPNVAPAQPGVVVPSPGAAPQSSPATGSGQALARPLNRAGQPIDPPAPPPAPPAPASDSQKSGKLTPASGSKVTLRSLLESALTKLGMEDGLRTQLLSIHDFLLDKGQDTPEAMAFRKAAVDASGGARDALIQILGKYGYKPFFDIEGKLAKVEAAEETPVDLDDKKPKSSAHVTPKLLTLTITMAELGPELTQALSQMVEEGVFSLNTTGWQNLRGIVEKLQKIKNSVTPLPGVAEGLEKDLADLNYELVNGADGKPVDLIKIPAHVARARRGTLGSGWAALAPDVGEAKVYTDAISKLPLGSPERIQAEAALRLVYAAKRVMETKPGDSVAENDIPEIANVAEAYEYLHNILEGDIPSNIPDFAKKAEPHSYGKLHPYGMPEIKVMDEFQKHNAIVLGIEESYYNLSNPEHNLLSQVDGAQYPFLQKKLKEAQLIIIQSITRSRMVAEGKPLGDTLANLTIEAVREAIAFTDRVGDAILGKIETEMADLEAELQAEAARQPAKPAAAKPVSRPPEPAEDEPQMSIDPSLAVESGSEGPGTPRGNAAPVSDPRREPIATPANPVEALTSLQTAVEMKIRNIEDPLALPFFEEVYDHVRQDSSALEAFERLVDEQLADTGRDPERNTMRRLLQFDIDSLMHRVGGQDNLMRIMLQYFAGQDPDDPTAYDIRLDLFMIITGTKSSKPNPEIRKAFNNINRIVNEMLKSGQVNLPAALPGRISREFPALVVASEPPASASPGSQKPVEVAKPQDHFQEAILTVSRRIVGFLSRVEDNSIRESYRGRFERAKAANDLVALAMLEGTIEQEVRDTRTTKTKEKSQKRLLAHDARELMRRAKGLPGSLESVLLVYLVGHPDQQSKVEAAAQDLRKVDEDFQAKRPMRITDLDRLASSLKIMEEVIQEIERSKP